MKCPRCNADNFFEVEEEVDIGVGNLKHLLGGKCPMCGNINLCSFCGEWETTSGINHKPWCDVFKEKK